MVMMIEVMMMVVVMLLMVVVILMMMGMTMETRLQWNTICQSFLFGRAAFLMKRFDQLLLIDTFGHQRSQLFFGLDDCAGNLDGDDSCRRLFPSKIQNHLASYQSFHRTAIGWAFDQVQWNLVVFVFLHFSIFMHFYFSIAWIWYSGVNLHGLNQGLMHL